MKYLTILFLTIILFSCDYIDNLNMESEVITKTYPAETVQKLIVNAPCKVTLVNNDTDIIIAEGQEHLVEDLIISTNNNILTINHSKKDYLQKSKLISLTINGKQLAEFETNSVMYLYSKDTIKGQNLNLVINGSAKFTDIDLLVKNATTNLSIFGINNVGEFILGGTSNSTNIIMEGSVNVYADNLKSNSVTIVQKSIGECKVFANKNLNAFTHSSGNIIYKGNPEVNIVRTESLIIPPTGKIIKE